MNECFDFDIIRHSAAHVLAAAMLRLFPDAKLDIGPSTLTGFYYEFDLDHKFSQGNLEKIEGGMLDIICEGQKFIKSVVTRDQATAMMESKNQRIKESKNQRIKHLNVNGSRIFQ
jgi:threonyl-tRNA synthetase